jgi:PAS domain S-box-containing protein
MGSVWIVLLLGALCGVSGYAIGRRRTGSAVAGPVPANDAAAQPASAPVAADTAPRIENVFHPATSEDERRRNAIYAKVFNLVPDTLTITRISDGRFVDVNHNWEELTGFKREAAIGHTSAELGVWVEPEQRAQLIASLKSGKPVRDFDVTFKRPNGDLYYNKVSASIFEAEGETYMMLAVKDVSAKRAADIELRELNQTLESRVQQRTHKLEEANAELATALEQLRRAQDDLVRSEKLAALGSLVAGVAHELNTPLGNGLMVATTLDDRLKELEKRMAAGLRRSDLDGFVSDAKHAHAVIVRNLERAAELVRSFKQVAVDRTSSQRRRFNLGEVVDETVLTLSPVLRLSGHELVTQVDEKLELDSYPGPLGQVLANLIDNALTHAFAPGQAGRIELLGRAGAAGEIRIEVHDSGHGIPAEHLSRVFDPFFTTRMGQGGSGLGLHIVHNLVTSVLGGRISVSNAADGGARFTIALPVSAPAVEDEPA